MNNSRELRNDGKPTAPIHYVVHARVKSAFARQGCRSAKPYKEMDADGVLFALQAPHVDEVTSDGRRCRHRRADQVRSAAGSLPTLEVSVTG